MTAAEKKRIKDRIAEAKKYYNLRISKKGEGWKTSLEGKKIQRRIDRLNKQLNPTPTKPKTQLTRKESRTGRNTAGNTTTRNPDTGKTVPPKTTGVKLADSPNQKKGKSGNQGRVVLDGMKKKVKLEPSMNAKKKNTKRNNEFGAMSSYMNANFNRRK
jgi:hypothetical protein